MRHAVYCIDNVIGATIAHAIHSMDAIRHIDTSQSFPLKTGAMNIIMMLIIKKIKLIVACDILFIIKK